MTTHRWLLLGLTALAAGASGRAALAEPAFRLRATPGTRHYRYASLERTPGRPDRRYRVDFDLVTGADRSVVAVIRKAESASGDAWTTPAVDAACRKALHGHGDELARVTLAPVAPEVAASLGDAFMATCAPAAYFFPMTDILNVAVIQTQPRFHLAELTEVGRSARYARFETKLDRLGVAIVAASPGGRVTLDALDGHAATIDWAPDPMQLSIVRHAAEGAPEITLRGEERFAFRLELDPASGVLRRAATTEDTLDLEVSMPGVPADKAPRVAITREVTIEPRGE